MQTKLFAGASEEKGGIMIILIASEKGGAGKTTIATNIAAMLANKDHDVLLLDTDTQGSSVDWGSIRNNFDELPPISVLQRTGSINKEVARLVSKYDDIVIDAGGRDSDAMRSAMLVSHVWYIPLRASQFDVWTISKMATLYEQMHSLNSDLRPYVLVNGASTHASHNDYNDVKEVLTETTDLLKMSSCQLYERTAYRKAAGQGRGVIELLKHDFDRKAAYEIEQLYKEMFHA